MSSGDGKNVCDTGERPSIPSSPDLSLVGGTGKLARLYRPVITLSKGIICPHGEIGFVCHCTVKSTQVFEANGGPKTRRLALVKPPCTGATAPEAPVIVPTLFTYSAPMGGMTPWRKDTSKV